MFFDSRNGTEVIDQRECLELLAANQVGRLAVIDGTAPLILPVNYALDDETILFRTGEGTKLAASRGGAACFEIDGVDTTRRRGWSVVVRGNLHEVTAHDQSRLDRLGPLVNSWVSERSHLIELQSWSVTGRRLRDGTAKS